MVFHSSGYLVGMSTDDLLKLLEAHGQQFLQSFDTPVTLGKRKDVSHKAAERSAKKTRVEETVEHEEWEGIQSDSDFDEEDESGEDVSEDAVSDGEDEDGESSLLRQRRIRVHTLQRTMTSPTKAIHTSQTLSCSLRGVHPQPSSDSQNLASW